MQISIKPVCDWPIYLTASADERLACIVQTSFHSTASFVNPIIATMAQNWIIANSLLTYTKSYLSLPPYLSYYNWTLPSFFLYSSSNLISILLSYHVDFPHSLPSRSSHLHTVILEANLLIALWKSFPDVACQILLKSVRSRRVIKKWKGVFVWNTT